MSHIAQPLRKNVMSEPLFATERGNVPQETPQVFADAVWSLASPRS